jgi:hypothetical protein
MRLRNLFFTILFSAILSLTFTVCDEETTPTSTHTHVWGEWTQATPPTCSEAGSKTRICTIDSSHTQTEIGDPPLGHDMGDWIETAISTYITEGLETYTCKRIGCGHSGETRFIKRMAIASVDELNIAIGGLSANTIVTPYTLRLNMNDVIQGSYSLQKPSDISAAITGSGKYVNLDMSDSTFTSIGEFAFLGCTNLTGVIMPDTVSIIDDAAFADCINITSVTIPNNVTRIGGQAFGPTGITSVTIPKNVTYIENYAFYSCDNLSSVKFEGNITSGNFGTYHAFSGDLRTKYLAGGVGTYTATRSGDGSDENTAVWTKQ